MADVLLERQSLLHCAHALKATQWVPPSLYTNLQNRTFAINIFDDGYAGNYKIELDK